MSDSRRSEIHQRALAAANGFRRAEAELISALAEVETQRVFQAMGYPSLFVYATQELRLSNSTAFSMITVMRKSREVPELREKIASGELSVSVAQKVVSVLNAENQSEWLEKAVTLSVRKLEKEIVRENPRAATIEKAKYTSDHRLSLNIGVDESLMLKFRKAQDLVSGSIQAPATMEATLEQITEFYLKHKDPVRKAERVVAKKGLNTQASVPALKKTEPSGASREVFVRTHTPAAITHSARLRDQGKCQTKLPNGEMCGSTRWTELHHIVPVAQGGKHELKNLVTLCSAHHRQTHHPFTPPTLHVKSRGGSNQFEWAKPNVAC